MVTAEVVKVIDGDTFEISDGTIIRITDFNAPEIKAYGGQRAKDTLSELVLNQTVGIEEKARDKYGRLVAGVYIYRNGGWRSVVDFLGEFSA